MSDTTTNNASTTTVNNEVAQNNEEVSLPTLSPSLFFSSNLTRSRTSTFVSKQVKKTIVETENKNENVSATTETKEEKKIVTKVDSLFLNFAKTRRSEISRFVNRRRRRKF